MNTKLFFWNVRGINDQDKYQPFVKWLKNNKLIFGALLETHIKEASLNQIMSTICNGWSFTLNHNQDESDYNLNCCTRSNIEYMYVLTVNI